MVKFSAAMILSLLASWGWCIAAQSGSTAGIVAGAAGCVLSVVLFILGGREIDA